MSKSSYSWLNRDLNLIGNEIGPESEDEDADDLY